MIAELSLGLLLVAATALGSCTRPVPTTTVLGTFVSPDGKQVLTLFAVVPGSILDDYLALNLSKVGGQYSSEETVASFSRASEMRVFWKQTGRPAAVAKDLAGTIFAYGKASRLIVCRQVDHCPSMSADGPFATVAKYPSD